MLSGQDYASRLREETRKELAHHLQTLEEDIRTLQTSLSTSFAQIAQKLGSTLELEVPAAEAILADTVKETEKRKEDSRDEEMLQLARFAHDMRQSETQEEILNSLLDGAHRYAPRLVLFVARGNHFIAWSSRGFSDETALRKCSFPILDSQLLREALDADGLITVNDLSNEPVLLQAFPEGAQWPWHAFPMKAIHRPVAVLLATAADGRKCDLESLCILMDLTGLCIENIALKILQEVKFAKPPVPAPSPQPPAEKKVEAEPAALSGGVEKEPEETRAPEETEPAVPADLTAEVSTDAGAEIEDEVQATTANLEPLPSASTAEAPPTDEEARTIPAAPPEEPQRDGTTQATEEQEPAMSPTAEMAPAVELAVPESVRPAILREVQPLTEEEKLHADAKRFARLLASEIKLYNEQRVLEGRANRDLYVRLKRDIDRSRDMYQKRVSPLVSLKVDYFHDEVIRILGDNDPSTLGSEYPGPRVES
ncbi:MAG: hypothetical protein ABSC02_09955 [Acidobacteriota bacterium]|jgi:hypothetical protein